MALIKWARVNVKTLQAIAAITAICTAAYTVFVRDFIRRPPAAVATGYTSVSCSKLVAVTGDTVECDGVAMRELGDGAPYKTGIATPDVVNPRCPNERILGELAKARLAKLLDGVKHVEDSGAVDPSGRPLVKLRLKNGRTAGAVLLSEGVAIVWYPGYIRPWCK